MTQALYAHMNNKKINLKKKIYFKTKKKKKKKKKVGVSTASGQIPALLTRRSGSD
jgi:hypothetical protein